VGSDRCERLTGCSASWPRAIGDSDPDPRIDRLARSTFDLSGIVKRIVDAKAQFRSLAEPWADTGTSTGRLMLAVLGGLAGVERDLIRTRTPGPQPGAEARAAHGPETEIDRGAAGRGPQAAGRRCHACRTRAQLPRRQEYDFTAEETVMPLPDDHIARIKQRVEAAFKPLRCVAEVWDYKEKIAVKVFDKDDSIVIERPNSVLRDLADETRLMDFIEEIRERVQAKGFALH
jgi:hypothetical protein